MAERTWRADDPGKRIDAHLSTPEWKALRLAASARGISLKAAVRQAVAEYSKDPG